MKKNLLTLLTILPLAIFSQVTLPWTEDFEAAGNDTYTANTSPLTNLPEWQYVKTNNGRLRLQAGGGFYNGGSNAATMDANPDGTQSENYLICELDMSNYIGATNIEMEFYFTHHGEENHNQDRVHIRGSNSDTWIEIYNWYANRPAAGTFQQVTGLDIDAALTGAGQAFSSTFQIRFGQRDNYRATSTTGSDGFTVDDIMIYEVVPPDCNWEVCLEDSYGDGWNGGSIEVIVGGVSMGSYTLNSGGGPACLSIPIHIGDDIELDYTAGSWSYENEYYLYDSYGNLVHSEGSGETTPGDYTYTGADCDPHPVTPTDQDCLGAISICGDTYSTTLSYSGTGNIPNEINGGSSCLEDGERNDVWYIFTVQQDGDLMFNISPNDPADDYDWAVYDLTSSNCSDIATDPTIEVSCNYSGTSGDTGPDGSTIYSSQGAGGTPFNDAIPVLTGEVYVINVSNWSTTQNGYFIDFSMASGVIVDTSPPELDTIVNSPTCGQDQLTFWFNELVDTNSVSAGDFTVTGPGGTYNVTDILGTGGSDMEREYLMTLDAQLIAGGTYTLNFTGQVDDACGNSVIGNSLNFTVDGISGAVSVNDGSVLCYDDAVGSATASATGGSGTYSYLWEGGATTATINNLAAGDYDVTISDNVGVCYDIVTATVNPSNPLVATGTWVGTSNSDWNNCENWGGGRVPLSSMDVTIPGGCSNYPVVSLDLTVNGTTGDCNSILVENGGSLTINNNRDLIVDNAFFRVESGGSLSVADDIEISSGATFNQAGGNITILGDILNNATYTSSGGDVLFNGTTIQSVDGSQSCTFTDITIDNSGDGLKIETNTTINGNITFVNGDLDLKDSDIDLGTTGAIVNETAANKIKSTDGGGFPLPNIGTIKATRDNPSGNVAGLGINISPSAALGTTTITRGHDELSGTGTYTANSSILRYYEIRPGSKAVTPCDLTFSYHDSELNGHTDGTLEMFQQVQMTWNGTPGPVYWTPLSTTNSAAANTAIATTINNNLTTTVVTLGSASTPLPVELVEFTNKCHDNYVSLEWTTASEINNNYFTLEKSYDGLDFQDVVNIPASGNSNQLTKYSYADYSENNGNVYYRLKQTDFDGKFKFLSTINSDCNTDGEKLSADIIPVGNQQYYVSIKGCNSESLHYYVTDELGRKLISGDCQEGGFTISLAPFKRGIYNLVIVCSDQVVVEKMIN